jgi:hypothetical protein
MADTATALDAAAQSARAAVQDSKERWSRQSFRWGRLVLIAIFGTYRGLLVGKKPVLIRYLATSQAEGR